MAPVVSVVRNAPMVCLVRGVRSGCSWRDHRKACVAYSSSFLSSDRVEYRARATHSSERERAKTVAAYYNQPAIEAAAQKKSVRLTPSAILYHGRTDDETTTLKSALYLQKELPVRIAKRVLAFRSLPFIVGCNPIILGVHELYIRAFNILNNFAPITSRDDEINYSRKLGELLDDHKDVVTQLAAGFRECRRHIKNEDLVAQFLDRTLTSRLGIRMLAQHHLALRENKPNYVGIINVGMKLKEVIERSCQFVSRVSSHKYGRVPLLKLSGHVNAVFPYIELPLDYILPEILKNAVRATIENHSEFEMLHLPPIHITIASNEIDFIIRISDRGGGIPHHLTARALDYNFTTANDTSNSEIDQQEGVFSNMMEAVNPNPAGGPMHGFGFGLPTSRAYAEYMGGSLEIQAMQGIGTDVYLRLKHINSPGASFRI
ncbi:3-methyl-2-oxobutanoate dehydrogenase [lipoamide] kinase, mitochondrial-like isoform X2 [Homarus americanus]|uniref:3-methyl-2-oxobutanoate dehydrogenase [lipoamide] kinase, mitochondrial-like isoform X2 n=1 Tax=Homarus americanus TaxID=6706 RepID=UPI001C457FEC|nr:3-methyl-2-oxobutanoate dehydrogenase [lipoamide] kinase, mitochondrial-like isoform X2 [Homarus americanus]